MSEPEQSPSTLQILVGTYQGRMLLLSGIVYTVIVSLSLALLYFFGGANVTLAITAVYVVLTSALVYFRAPRRQLVAPALLVFTIIPVSIGAGTVLVMQSVL